MIRYLISPAFLVRAAALLASSVVALGAVTGCSANGNAGRESISVVATTTQIGDFASRVGGEIINLTVLLRPNQEAHDFEPEPSQLRAIAGADLVLQNGLDLDSFVDKALEQGDSTLIVVTQGVQTRAVGDEKDPHVWHSVPNVVVMVENIRDALVAADPDNAAAYQANAAAYIAELELLDSEIRGLVSGLPEACRKLITNHDVFAYFAEEYGLDLLGSLVPSTSSAVQASASDVGDMVELIRAAGVPAVFADVAGNSGLLQRAASEAGVNLVDELYGDSLGPAGSEGETYISMMRWNSARIVEALSGC